LLAAAYHSSAIRINRSYNDQRTITDLNETFEIFPSMYYKIVKWISRTVVMAIMNYF